MEKLKILIPTDFSVQAEFAFLMVKKLGEKIPVEIHFLHVMNVPDTVTLDANGDIKTCGEIDVRYVTTQKEIAERKLDELKNIYSDNISTHFILGKITDSILDFAEAQHFDLIAMGTKGAWGLKEKLSGTGTQIIARKSAIPVLSLMCDRSQLSIEHILFVHNFDQPVEENLQFMHKLSVAFDSKFHFLQIIPGKVDAEKMLVESNMKAFAAINNITNYECHLINDSDVENGVIHFNQINNMDIVCIGTRGKAGFFHHSITEKLINHLFKPIISFHLN